VSSVARASCLVATSAIPARAEVETFSIVTADGTARLNGQIDWPEGDAKAVVIMVAGTGLFDRHVLFGNSGTDGDFLFRVLSEALVAKGVATLRFDMRGVSGNERSVAGGLQAFVDTKVRAAVTPETIQSDLKQIFDFAVAHDRLTADQVIAFGHSEGCIHLGRLLSAGKIRPRGFLLMGLSAESPKSLIRWQLTERMLRLIMARDAEGDGTVTNQQIDAGGLFLDTIAPKIYHSPTGSWTEEPLRQFLVRGYDAYAAEVIATPDDQPHGYLASKRWWKMYYVDDRPVIDDFADFEGPIVVHNGELDSQTPADRQFELVRARMDGFASKPQLIVHKRKGHSLGSRFLRGPMAADSIQLLVKDVLDMCAP